MKMIVAVIASVALLLNVVDGLSTGAPDPACVTISPNPDAMYHNATAQTVASPFTLMIQGSPTVYVPGRQYTLTFERNIGTFRGFLVVPQNMNGDRVGSFTAGTNQKQTCADLRGITHSENSDKMTVSFVWTAPPECTGPVTFRYAGVEIRQMFWANQMGPVFNETTPSKPCSSALSAQISGTLMIVSLLVMVLVARMM